MPTFSQILEKSGDAVFFHFVDQSLAVHGKLSGCLGNVSFAAKERVNDLLFFLIFEPLAYRGFWGVALGLGSGGVSGISILCSP